MASVSRRSGRRSFSALRSADGYRICGYRSPQLSDRRSRHARVWILIPRLTPQASRRLGRNARRRSLLIAAIVWRQRDWIRSLASKARPSYEDSPIDFNGLDSAVYGPVRLGVLTALQMGGSSLHNP